MGWPNPEWSEQVVAAVAETAVEEGGPWLPTQSWLRLEKFDGDSAQLPAHERLGHLVQVCEWTISASQV